MKAVRAHAIQLTALAAIWIYFIASSPTLRGSAAVFPVVEGFALLGIIAAGVAVTMIAGELDLSVASMAALAGIVAVKLSALGLVPSLIAATALGVIVGLLQGCVIARVGINSLVLTIGTLILLRGVAYVVSGEETVLVSDLTVGDPLLQQYGIFSPASLTGLAVVLALGLFLAYTRYGREIYASGGGREEARAAGVATSRALVIAFAISGGAAALAGALSSMQSGSGAPQGFSDLLLTAIAAGLIGGISLYGGRGSMVNVALGVLILSVISAGLADRGAQTHVTQVVIGGLLVFVIGAEYASRRLAGARERSAARRRLVAA